MILNIYNIYPHRKHIHDSMFFRISVKVTVFFFFINIKNYIHVTIEIKHFNTMTMYLNYKQYDDNCDMIIQT